MKILWWLIASFILVSYVAEVNAEIRITGGGYSTHLVSDDITNESHDHIAVQYQGIEVGRFNNSWGEESWYATHEWRHAWGDIQGFVKAGAVYGYRGLKDQERDRGWVPLAAPGLRYTGYAVQPEVTLFGDAVSLGASLSF